MPEAPEIVKELVEKFERNIKAYKNPQYKEEQLKQEFLNPFFKALGWDVDNSAGAAPQYRNVIFEDSIKIGGGTKAPDYCFTLSGQRKFFVEAKKPSENIKDNKNHAYQLRRYAWSEKLPLSILTDFEELAIYESRVRPKKDDKTAKERIKFFNYKDYVDNWDYIYSKFSYEAVLNGSFDKFAEDIKGKRGTQEVDDEFLSEIEEWRELLARNIAIRNKNLSVDEVNYSVQQIIDRIIFLRIGEDRGLETYGKLLSLLTLDDIYDGFCEMCNDADTKYNSGLFYFKEERGRNTSPDKLTLTLNVDNGVLRTILKRLYYPDSPYEFSVLSPEILGNVYEQFLGKVIRLTHSHMAKIEEKPEVKKAGGVYYTPQYIVNYIVENTVGNLCRGMTPNKVSKLKILDPACGSGSFLLGAYTYLLKWHLDYYSNLKDKGRLSDKIYKGKDDGWYLTIKEKKRILINNIFGVDIDQQAVEVTKLTLLLKVLERESKDVIEAQQKLFKERALPDLEENIKCGNSLIESDFYDNDELELSEEEIKRVNVFDWNDNFPEIMENGGFDAVIGNPPYIRIQSMKEWANKEVEFYKEKYETAKKGNFDIYVIFVQKGLELLNDKGVLGFIISHKFFKRSYGEKLRSLISENKNLDHIVHFGDQQVFKKITTYTCLLFLCKEGKDRFYYAEAHDLPAWKLEKTCVEGYVRANRATDKNWSFLLGPRGKLLDKLDDEFPERLENVTDRIFQGFKTGGDDVFIVEELERKSDKVKVYSTKKDSEYWLEPHLLHPLVKGGNSRAYYLTPTTKRIIFPYIVEDNSVKPIPEQLLKKHFPLTWSYLNDNKKTLVKRDRGKMSKKWLQYSRTQALKIMSNPKILVPDVANCASYSLDKNGINFFTGGAAGGYGILVNEEYDREYILGLLNSKLLVWYIFNTSTEMRGGYFSFESPFIKKLPIKIIDFNNTQEVSLHNKVVSLVEQRLKLSDNLAKANIPRDIELIQRQIDATDKQIDNLVYELYGLTDEEIEIVEDMN